MKGKKLTDSELKALPSTDFCGPCRTFPIVDEAHYHAALKLLDKYEGGADVSAIWNCIIRKGKVNGYGKSEEDKIFDPTSVLKVDNFSEEELRLLVSHISENLSEPCDDCQDALAAENLRLADEVVRLEERVVELVDKEDELQAKYKVALQDVNVLQDKIYEDKVALRGLKERYLGLLEALKNRKTSDPKRFTELTDEVLDAEIQNINESIDVSKICDKLDNGMSGNPEGKSVDNPVGAVLDKAKDKDGRKVLDSAGLQNIMTSYMSIYMSRGEEEAEQFKKMIQRTYKIPEDLLKKMSVSE